MTLLTLRRWPVIDRATELSLARVLHDAVLVDGRAVDQLETDWATFLGAPREEVLTCSSGTHAITLALRAYDVGPGDEVIVPAYTFSGSVFPILQTGASPVFVDTHLDRHTLDLDQVAAAAAADTSQRIRAVIAVHLHGAVVDIPDLRARLDAAGRQDVRIIEDAAQAHGSTTGARVTDHGILTGRPVGLDGDAACWSLNQTKALPAGEGGLLRLPAQRAEHARSLRRFGEQWDGRSPRTYLVAEPHGGNGRMDELCAAVGLAQLPPLTARTRTARANAATLHHVLHDLDGHGLHLPTWDDGHSWQKYLVRFPDKELADFARTQALQAGLPVCLWQREPVSRHPGFAGHRVIADDNAATTTRTSVLLFTERHPLLVQDGTHVAQIARRLRALWSAL